MTFKDETDKEGSTNSVTDHPRELIPRWRARAVMGGHGWTDSAYGFGGADVAETAGTADDIGTDLTNFLDSLDAVDVEATRIRTGRFFLRLEVEPHTGDDALTAVRSNDAAGERVSLWQAIASDGNADGVFDACYNFGRTKGDEGQLVGTAQELGIELARVLKELTRDDVNHMKYGTDRFFLELLVEPVTHSLPRR